jgi:hypothetical protein
MAQQPSEMARNAIAPETLEKNREEDTAQTPCVRKHKKFYHAKGFPTKNCRG